jgi:hypothetical protein
MGETLSVISLTPISLQVRVDVAARWQAVR